ncbi:hypothetical protein ANN_07625 [Periplaneta americana]|uniref:Uncharacterized protein n=1 Tax=Periplaneta americana TaxID=6978 RepID=A0ABQ8T0I2_PERAM|nr:hypothetical protein ANN_07625 [Periplaneta americana]
MNLAGSLKKRRLGEVKGEGVKASTLIVDRTAIVVPPFITLEEHGSKYGHSAKTENARSGGMKGHTCTKWIRRGWRQQDNDRSDDQDDEGKNCSGAEYRIFIPKTIVQQRLRVFENKVIRKIFGAKGDEVTGEWRKLRNAELQALCSLPDIIRNIKSRRLRWAGHIARMGESKNAYRVLVLSLVPCDL